MTVQRLEHLDDPRLAPYRALSDRRLRQFDDSFVAEGRLVLERVIALGSFRVRSVLLGAAAYAALAPTLERLDPSVPVYVTSRHELEALTGHDFHRGCLALVERPASLSPERLLDGKRRVVVLEGVADADNVGSVFRSAAAFGVDAVLLDATSADPLYRKAIRTSMAATLRVPFARLGEGADGASSSEPRVGFAAALEGLRARGFELVALTPREPAETLAELAGSATGAPVALLFGNEGRGLSEVALARASRRVRIPIAAEVDSLNVAVAAAIVLARLAEASA